MQNRSFTTKWASFQDIDEFIHLGSRFKSVEELISLHDNDDALCLSWRLFGSSGLHFNGDYSVLNRFTHRQHGFNKHVKTMLNLKRLLTNHMQVFCVNPHFFIHNIYEPTSFKFQAKSVDGRPISGPFDMEAESHLDDDSPWLAHFFTKTPEEWKKKREQGRIDTPANSPELYRKDSEFAENDFNDVEDTSLRDVYTNTNC